MTDGLAAAIRAEKSAWHEASEIRRTMDVRAALGWTDEWMEAFGRWTAALERYRAAEDVLCAQLLDPAVLDLDLGE